MFLIRYVVIIFKKQKSNFAASQSITGSHKPSLSRKRQDKNKTIFFSRNNPFVMKKPKQIPIENIKELEEQPYKFFDGVDYRRIMALDIDSIRIDSKNEQKNAKDSQ